MGPRPACITTRLRTIRDTVVTSRAALSLHRLTGRRAHLLRRTGRNWFGGTGCLYLRLGCCLHLRLYCRLNIQSCLAWCTGSPVNLKSLRPSHSSKVQSSGGGPYLWVVPTQGPTTASRLVLPATNRRKIIPKECFPSTTRKARDD